MAEIPEDEELYSMVQNPRKVLISIDLYDVDSRQKVFGTPDYLTSDLTKVEKFLRLHGLGLKAVNADSSSQDSLSGVTDGDYQFIPMLVKKCEEAGPSTSAIAEANPSSPEISVLDISGPEEAEATHAPDNQKYIFVIPQHPNPVPPFPVDIPPIPLIRGPEKPNKNFPEEFWNKDPGPDDIDEDAPDPIPVQLDNFFHMGKSKTGGKGNAKGKGKKASASTQLEKYSLELNPATASKSQSAKQSAASEISSTQSGAGDNKREKKAKTTSADAPTTGPSSSSRPKRQVNAPVRYQPEDFTQAKRQKKIPTAPAGNSISTKTRGASTTKAKTQPPLYSEIHPTNLASKSRSASGRTGRGKTEGFSTKITTRATSVPPPSAAYSSSSSESEGEQQ